MHTTACFASAGVDLPSLDDVASTPPGHGQHVVSICRCDPRDAHEFRPNLPWIRPDLYVILGA